MDITMVRLIDHFKTRRRRSPSLPCRPVALVPTARFCGLIIFPRTPPEEFAPTVRLGLTPICWYILSHFLGCPAGPIGGRPRRQHGSSNYPAQSSLTSSTDLR